MSNAAVLSNFNHTPYLRNISLSDTDAITAEFSIAYSPIDGEFWTTEGFILTSRLPQWGGYIGGPGAGTYDVGSPYEIRLTVSSGVSPSTLTSSPVGSWIPMEGATVYWAYERASLGTGNATWLIEIRSAVSGSVITSHTVTGTATRT